MPGNYNDNITRERIIMSEFIVGFYICQWYFPFTSLEKNNFDCCGCEKFD